MFFNWIPLKTDNYLPLIFRWVLLIPSTISSMEFDFSNMSSTFWRELVWLSSLSSIKSVSENSVDQICNCKLIYLTFCFLISLFNCTFESINLIVKSIFLTLLIYWSTIRWTDLSCSSWRRWRWLAGRARSVRDRNQVWSSKS